MICLTVFYWFYNIFFYFQIFLSGSDCRTLLKLILFSFGCWFSKTFAFISYELTQFACERLCWFELLMMSLSLLRNLKHCYWRHGFFLPNKPGARKLNLSTSFSHSLTLSWIQLDLSKNKAGYVIPGSLYLYPSFSCFLFYFF